MKNSLIDIVSAIVIALGGGLTSFLMNERHSWFQFIISMVTAGFAGWLTFLLLKEVGASENIISFCCGLAGLSGKTLLDVYQKVFIARVQKLDVMKPFINNDNNNNNVIK